LQEAQLLRARFRAAELRDERANAQLRRARDALPEVQVEKRQRAAASAVSDHPRVAQGGQNPNGWSHFCSYTGEKYQEEEVKEQDRRDVEVPKQGDVDQVALPPGDESRGWHTHWRHGVYGSL